MFAILVALAVHLTYHPQISQTAPGSYFELVKIGYDPATNMSHGVFERYDRDVAQNDQMYFTYVMTLPGKITSQQMIDAEAHSEYVKLTDSTNLVDSTK